MKRVLFLFFLLNIVSSCTYVLTETAKAIDNTNRLVPPPPNPNKFVQISIDEDYQISLPRYMYKYDKVLDEALITFGNDHKSLHTIVIKRDLSHFENYKDSDDYLIDSIPLIESYKNFYLDDVNEFNSNLKFEEYGLLEINNYKASQLKLFATENNYDTAQIITFLLTDDQIYHIISWTSKEKFEKNIGVMEQIPFTFEKKTIY